MQVVNRGTAPAGFRTETFIAEPLTVSNAQLDYECYMASPDVIRIHSDGRWPVTGFSLADDIAMAAAHEIDHQAGRSLAYVLLTPSRNQALGCLYLKPLPILDPLAAHVPSITAVVTFWIRQDRQHTDLPRQVAEKVNRWILDGWPLGGHVFRVLPTEDSSCSALDAIGCRAIDLDVPGEERPYLWFASSTS